MSQQSYLLLELDTTPPEIEIIAPRYTTHDITNEITITANEPLSSFQEIYTIDSQGNRFNHTFKHNGNEFIGSIRFNELSFGVATIYAQLKDEVGNPSALVSKPIEIKESLSRLNLSISDSCRNITTSEKVRNIKSTENVRGVQINDTDII